MFAEATCDADAGACAGTGPPCTTDRCVASTVVTCRAGREVTFDCALLG